MEGDSSIRIPGFTPSRGGGGGKERRERTAMFNNVLGISVEECTIVCKTHGMIQLKNEPKSKEE